MKTSGSSLSFGLSGAVALVLTVMGAGAVSAQIVPHTSSKASAAYSSTAAVQTGSGRRPTCEVCTADDLDRITTTGSISPQRKPKR